MKANMEQGETNDDFLFKISVELNDEAKEMFLDGTKDLDIIINLVDDEKPKEVKNER